MIWIVGIVSIALMLVILAIEPSQLLVMTQGLSSHQWQWGAYILLILAGVCAVTAFLLAKRQLSYHHISQLPQQALANSKADILVCHPLTPISQLTRQGIPSLAVKILAVLFIFAATISQTIAQRSAFAEASISQVVYVDALVTPIGLSDKRFAIDSDESSYRQLVHLSDIQPFDARQAYQSTANEADIARHTDNPFDSGIPSDKSINNDRTATQTSLTDLPKQMTVMLSAYQAQYSWLNGLAPDQQIRMRLTLTPLEMTQEDDRFDEYRWLSTRHATATAHIIQANQEAMQRISHPDWWQRINSHRHQLREHFLAQYVTTDNSPPHNQAAAVTLSLLTGDRSLISQEMTGLYRFAGISHLLAISGAHVLFLAILSASLVSGLVGRITPRLYRIITRWQLRLLVAVLVAFVYAVFAGFDVPAVRTAWMLMMIGVVRYLLAAASIFKVLLVLAVLMAWQDVFVLWQAGYWLSFVAVAVLIIYSKRWGRETSETNGDPFAVTQLPSPVATEPELTWWQQGKQVATAFFRLQLWMSIALLPVSLWLFGKVSLWGLVVNLFAIGLYGWVIVPLNLLAGLSHVISPMAAGWIWSVVIWILQGFHELLALLQSWASRAGWLYTEISSSVLLLILLAVLPWLLPRGLLSRYLSLPAFVVIGALPLLPAGIDSGDFAINHHSKSADAVHIHLLDAHNKDMFATLVSTEDANWLLLSAYTNKYNHRQADDHNKRLSEGDVQRSTQALYDSLRKLDIDMLTGIIVQTASPEMADVVAELRQDVPILNYWQAGLNANLAAAAHNTLTSTKETGITPQSCETGKAWSSADHGMSLQAVTGWQEIKDSSVWDCVVKVRSEHPIIVNGVTTQSKAGNSNNTLPALYKRDKVDMNKIDEVIIYSSQQPRLAKLWQLLCPPTDTAIKQHWLLSPQADLDKGLITMMQPTSLTIMTLSGQKPSAKVIQAEQYWQLQGQD